MSAVSVLLGRFPSPTANLANDLRRLILDVTPLAREAVNLDHNCFRYSHARCGYFCGLFPQWHAVQVVFEFGVLLPDPDGLLEGSGPHVRFVTVHHLAMADADLRRLVAASFALPRRREQKYNMVERADQQRRSNELLYSAIQHGTAEDVRGALAAGANPNGEPGNPSPLAYACLHRTWDEGRVEIVRLLMEAGAKVQGEGDGPLLVAGAARHGRPEVVKLLLDYGVTSNGALSGLHV